MAALHTGRRGLPKKHAPASYPGADDACAYCQQPLTANAVELVKKYRDFSNNDIKTALDKAERELRDYIAPVADLKIDALRAATTPTKRTVAADVLDACDRRRADQEARGSTSPAGAAMTWTDKDAAVAAAEKHCRPPRRPG